MRELMQRARAFVFAAEEDFGITPVEAQACGTPVIAFGKGGALETIIDFGSVEAPTGMFFYEQTAEAIVDAVERFEQERETIDAKHCCANARRFSRERFRQEFYAFVERKRSAKADATRFSGTFATAADIVLAPETRNVGS
jgi:glycosyltransferase involved in cell wall biosynthesis